MRWFTADPHFGHARINELANRPFQSVQEMNEVLIARWNAVVDPVDDVWILGDLALGPIEESLQLVKRLNGTKVLVPGNHDRVHPMMLDKDKPRSLDKFNRMADLYQSVGLRLSPVVNASLRIADQWVTVSHFPPTGDHQIQGDRFPEWRPKDHGQWVVHGHVHGEWLQRGRWINVGVDPWGFTPVAEQQIIELIEKGPQDR